MTEDELAEVYIVHMGWEYKTEHMDEEEYAFYKEALIDTLGFAVFRLHVAVIDLLDEMARSIKNIFSRR